MSRLALALLLFAACAAPQETQSTTIGPPSTTTPVAADSDPDEQVCTDETSTGTLVRRSVCRSRAQIERERREAEDMYRKGGNVHPKDVNK